MGRRDPVRRCTTCSLLGKEPVPEATMVMENAEGLQWFECDYHDDPEDHPDGPWVKRVALPRFFRQVELMANDLNSEQQLEELRSKFDRAREALLYAPCVLCPNDPVGTAVVYEVQFVARETAPIDESPPTLPTGQAPGHCEALGHTFDCSCNLLKCAQCGGKLNPADAMCWCCAQCFREGS